MTVRKIGPFVACLALLLSACAAQGPASAAAPRIFTEVPEQIDPNARYLIYLHGAIIEREGERPTHPVYGVYEYREILEVFAEKGFVVISEARPEGTDGMLYAARVVDQVRALLEADVPPSHITVLGFSKGGGIAIAASSMLAEDDVNFVFMAACNPWLDSHPEIVTRGRLLSLRESSDDLVRSCEGLLERSPSKHQHSEVLLDLGGGHGAFYRPQPEWIDPVVEWASSSP
ncbi:MAG: alpha/beta hydrolase [Acidobacteriota bacterium]